MSSVFIAQLTTTSIKTDKHTGRETVPETPDRNRLVYQCINSTPLVLFKRDKKKTYNKVRYTKHIAFGTCKRVTFYSINHMVKHR